MVIVTTTTFEGLKLTRFTEKSSTRFEELEFMRFTENTATSVVAEFKDGLGCCSVHISKQDKSFVAIFPSAQTHIRELDLQIYSRSLGRTVSAFNPWFHHIFNGAVLTQTRLQWLALERSYWKYLKAHEPADFGGFYKKYIRETSISQRRVQEHRLQDAEVV